MTKLIDLIKPKNLKTNLCDKLHVNYINEQNKDGITALAYLRASWQNIEAVKLLIDAGVDINYTTQNNFTALHFAVFENKIDIAKLLIKKGIDVKIKTIQGRTALDLAKRYSSPEMIQLLEEASLKRKSHDKTNSINYGQRYYRRNQSRLI